MWKLLIAEDETTIRRGLRNAIQWDDYSIEVVGEAEDGEVALEMAEEVKPDILFVDINMPFLNGLELMERLREKLPESIFIVITGYDEFDYAQQAIKMNAFDYILKPVKKEELAKTVRSATEVLHKNRSSKERERQLEWNKHLLKEKFLLDWSIGKYNKEEVIKQSELLKIKLETNVGLTVFKVVKDIDVSGSEQAWSDLLLRFSLKNIIKDFLKEHSNSEVFEDQYGHIVVLIPAIETQQLLSLNRSILTNAERIIGKVIVHNERMIDSYMDFPRSYKNLVKELDSEKNLSPMVLLAKNYIDQNYFDQSVSLQQVASHVQVNPTYLSKQIKNELGVSFIQYLTNVRINKAIKLIKDPYLKVYEVAEMVGYSTQHYFCSAFKKVVGISPSDYRSGVKVNE